MSVYSGTQFDVKLGKNYSVDLLRTNLALNGFQYFFLDSILGQDKHV